jgi:DUF4097 and DUF4098 domain-containing protein YvlB
MNWRKPFCCCFGLLVFLAACNAIAYGEERQENRRSFTLNPGATVSLGNISGDIKISSWNGTQAEMVAVKTGPASQLDKVEIKIDAQPSRLSIETIYPKQANNRVSVSFDLKVPRNINLDFISSVSGNISIADIDGRVVGRSVSGDIKASRFSQQASLESVSGNVQVTETGGRTSVKSVSGDVIVGSVNGDLEAKTVSGDARIGQVRGYIQAESISGDVTISGSEPTGLKASTVSGDIRFDGRLNANGRYDLKSHSGTVTMELPADSSFALHVSRFSGSFSSDFAFNAEMSNKSFSGVVGAGGPTVEMSGFSGTVQILKSKAK